MLDAGCCLVSGKKSRVLVTDGLRGLTQRVGSELLWVDFFLQLRRAISAPSARETRSFDPPLPPHQNPPPPRPQSQVLLEKRGRHHLGEQIRRARERRDPEVRERRRMRMIERRRAAIIEGQ